MTRIEAALQALPIPFRHYAWSGLPTAPYGVWGEDGESALHAESRHAETVDSCYVDLFTRDDTGRDRDLVEAALAGAGIAWALAGTQYEQPTGLLHYTWDAEVPREAASG